MKKIFQEVPEFKIICNFSLHGHTFPGKHNKKAKSHNHFMSLDCVDEDGRKLSHINIDGKLCGCTMNGFNSQTLNAKERNVNKLWRNIPEVNVTTHVCVCVFVCVCV